MALVPQRGMTGSSDRWTRCTAWLIEWPVNDNMPPRWWHPQGGWMLDVNKAVRFCRRQDAEAYIKGGCFVSTVIATEHGWITADEDKT